MRCWRCKASDCATETLSTKPTRAISRAGSHNRPRVSASGNTSASAGRPCGTAPTTAIPAVWSSRPIATAAVATTTATIGASLASRPAIDAGTPQRSSSGAIARRASSRKTKVATPVTTVGRLACCQEVTRPVSFSITPAPTMRTPRMYCSWPIAISTAEPVMKPLMTGWLRKYARKPRRNTPNASSITPEIRASCTAIAAYSGLPASASGCRALAVISEATATGPTASVMLEPSAAYATSGRMLAYSPTCGGSPASMA